MTSASKSSSRPSAKARSLFEEGGAPPVGTRHFVGAEALARRALVNKLLTRFERDGYALVTTPVFDSEELFRAGAGLVEPRDYLRFVEPDSGITAVLRPDFTPQIARLTASRFRATRLPLRFSYEGSVFRRGRGRARKRREIAQVGVECIGDASFAADLQVLRLALEACRLAGVKALRVELSHAVIGHALVGANASAELIDAIARRDQTVIASLLRGERKRKAHLARITEALALGEDRKALTSAAKLFSDAASRKAIGELDKALRDVDRIKGVEVGVDFGEVRDLAYYTGLRFAIYARGPGEALGGGGRYDTLLSAHGMDAAAVGFGLDLDNVSWAMGDKG